MSFVLVKHKPGSSPFFFVHLDLQSVLRNFQAFVLGEENQS